MEPRSLTYLAKASQGTIRGISGDAEVRGITTDSRQASAGDLFVALSGEKFDGHDFLAQVRSQGAIAALVRRGTELPEGLGAIEVEDPKRALGLMAGAYRQEFSATLVGVAGSNGKTSTKEFLGSILNEQGPALVNEASFNNDIGVPVTLLKLAKKHWAGVLEVGTNHVGELAPLVRLVQPRLGIVTNIGREHLEFFGNVETVAQEEGWLAELLPADGTLIVNGDQPIMNTVVARTRAKVIRCGQGSGNSWRARLVDMSLGGTRFEVTDGPKDFQGEHEIRLVGQHQVSNALLALAAAFELGVPAELARRGLRQCAGAKMRMQVSTVNGVILVDDSYNANADSAEAAFQTLQRLTIPGRRWLVLGDMAELGSETRTAHEEVGRQAAATGIAGMVGIGEWAGVTVASARSEGVEDAETVSSVEAVIGWLTKRVKSGDLVLLKASRAARLERVVTALRNAVQEQPRTP